MITAGVLGYCAMVALGVVLGLLGAGGSILAVPVLVYLFGVPATEATGYSLVIVGAAALVGAIEYLRRGQSSPKMAFVLGTPAVVGVYVTRRWLFPAIPDPVAQLGGMEVSKDAAVMVLFAAFMLAAAVSMMRGKELPVGAEAPVRLGLPVMIALGLGLGVFTGLVGAGGGFMILPVLVLVGGLTMKVAIGTDLLIIAAKSLIGFAGEAQAAAIDWGFVAVILVLPLAGIAIGTVLNRHVSAGRLRVAFGWFVLIMGSYILTRELF